MTTNFNQAYAAQQLTTTLLRFNTINPPGMERACAQHLGAKLEAAGFHCVYHEFAPSRTTLVATIGGQYDKPPICFTGHIDTVPLGAAAWSRDAFAGELDGDKLYGRGSTDMKSGVAAFVVAAITLAPQLKNSCGIVLIITASEETGCEGANDLVARQLLDRAGAIVVAEPTANYPCIGHKGLMWLEFEARGVTAHASMPEQGDNAVVKIARAINTLANYKFEQASHPLMGNNTLNVSSVQGGMNPNSVPDRASVIVDIRTVAGTSHAHICQSLACALGDGISMRKIQDVPSVYTDPDNEWVQQVFATCAPFVSEAIEPKTIQFSTDASALQRGYKNPPTIILGPGQPELAHQTDEWCSVGKLAQSVEIFTLLMRQWCL